MHAYKLSKAKFSTYIVNSINEGVVAAVAHCQPITAEPDNVDVPVSEENSRKYLLLVSTSPHIMNKGILRY